MIDKKISDINNIWSDSVVNNFIELLVKYEKVIIIGANNTSGDLIRFQQELVYANKVINVISGQYTSNEFVKQVEQDQLIIVVSSSGKFAELSYSWIKKLPGYKVLITGNKNEFFTKIYNEINFWFLVTISKSLVWGNGRRCDWRTSRGDFSSEAGSFNVSGINFIG